MDFFWRFIFLFGFCLNGVFLESACAQALKPALGMAGDASFPQDQLPKGNLPRPLTSGLSQIYNSTACGLNYVHGSVLVTNRDPTTATGTGLPAKINISGLPSQCYAIDKAYVWYIVSFTESSAPSSSLTVTNSAAASSTYASTLIKSGPPKCWNETGTANYRADVTAAVSGNGAYTFDISGFTNAINEIDGILFVIIYKDKSVSYTGTLVMDDGLIVNRTSTVTPADPTNETDSLSGFNACAASTSASAFLFATDLQKGVNFGNHTTTLNGTTYTFPNTFLVFNDTTTTVSNGQTIASFGTSDYGDCYAWGLMGLYFQNQCLSCTASPIALNISSTPVSCGNSNGSATVTASAGTPPYTYSWSPGAATTASISNLPAGTYSVTVHDAANCLQTTSIIVSSSGGLAGTISNAVNVSCAGGITGSATAQVSGGTGPYTYSWSPSGGNGASASGLSANTYTVTIHDANSCMAVVNVVITEPPPMKLTFNPVNPTCHGTCNGSIAASVSGGAAAYTWAWSPAGGSGASASSLCAGIYTCTVKDANGCSFNKLDTLSEPPALKGTLAGIDVTCNQSCNGQVICVPSGGIAPYQYSWNTSCTTASCSNICAGNYTLTLIDSRHCSVTDTVSVRQSTPLVLQLSSQASHCRKPDGMASVAVSGGSSPYTYNWSPGTGSSTSSYPNISPGTYLVSVTDNAGCKARDTVVVGNIPGFGFGQSTIVNPKCYNGADGSASIILTGGTSPFTYSWNPTPGGGQASSTVTGLSVGIYTCYVTDSAGCGDFIHIPIRQPLPLVISTGPVPKVCIGQGTSLPGSCSCGTSPYAYSWSLGGQSVIPPVSPVVTTTYTLQVIDANGCTALPQTLTVTVNPPLEVLASGAATICSKGSVALKSVASGGDGNYSYSWIPIPDLNSSIIPNPQASPAVTTTYTVILKDGCGSPADSSLVAVSVLAPPLLGISVNDSLGCAPLCVTFTSQSNPVCMSATWKFGDGDSAKGCGILQHCFKKPGSYGLMLNVTDSAGCRQSLSRPAYITVYPSPQASFTSSPQPTSILDPLISFTDMSTGASSWDWNFGDLTGAGSVLQNPSFTYPDTGCYPVILKVTNLYGCTNATVQAVCIEPYFTFYAPNTFTPNGDGKNDLFTPVGVGIDINKYEFLVFDRWGNLIFETHIWGEGWDGRASGGTMIAQVDTYVWKVFVSDFKGVRHFYLGHVNLVR
jgi:gliding motility-associated-like protein